MRMQRFAATTALAGLILAGFGSSTRAQSGTLDFVNAPVTDVVSQFHDKFGANIVLKNGISPYQTVSLSVDDPNNTGARLQMVNDLANALNADFSKVFVVSRIPDDTAVTVPVLDSNGAPVVFKSTSVPAEDAIRAIAGVDGASVQLYSHIEGNVNLSSTRLTAGEAAREVAAQTHTQWKAFYAVTPNLHGMAAGGRVIDHTASGSPIIELPLTTYRVAKEPPAPPVTPQPGALTGRGSGVTPQYVIPGAQDYNPYVAASSLNPYATGYNPYDPYAINPATGLSNGISVIGGTTNSPTIVGQ